MRIIVVIIKWACVFAPTCMIIRLISRIINYVSYSDLISNMNSLACALVELEAKRGAAKNAAAGAA